MFQSEYRTASSLQWNFSKFHTYGTLADGLSLIPPGTPQFGPHDENRPFERRVPVFYILPKSESVRQHTANRLSPEQTHRSFADLETGQGTKDLVQSR